MSLQIHLERWTGVPYSVIPDQSTLPDQNIARKNSFIQTLDQLLAFGGSLNLGSLENGCIEYYYPGSQDRTKCNLHRPDDTNCQILFDEIRVTSQLSPEHYGIVLDQEGRLQVKNGPYTICEFISAYSLTTIRLTFFRAMAGLRKDFYHVMAEPYRSHGNYLTELKNRTLLQNYIIDAMVTINAGFDFYKRCYKAQSTARKLINLAPSTLCFIGKTLSSCFFECGDLRLSPTRNFNIRTDFDINQKQLPQFGHFKIDPSGWFFIYCTNRDLNNPLKTTDSITILISDDDTSYFYCVAALTCKISEISPTILDCQVIYLPTLPIDKFNNREPLLSIFTHIAKLLLRGHATLTQINFSANGIDAAIENVSLYKEETQFEPSLHPSIKNWDFPGVSELQRAFQKDPMPSLPASSRVVIGMDTKKCSEKGTNAEDEVSPGQQEITPSIC